MAADTVRRVGVLTSGGDAPGMNAAIRAVVRAAHFHGMEPVGVSNGYGGLLDRKFAVMDLRSVGDIIHRGGTVLKSGRTPAMEQPDGLGRAVGGIRSAGLDALVVIGGDGSLQGGLALADMGIRVIGIPATIDNDVAGTERTIGFDTAVNTAVRAINQIRDTASAHERTFVIEVMGRNSGFIALAAGVAGGAESVLVPEAPVDLEQVGHRLQRGFQRGKAHSIIVVAEGADVGPAGGDGAPTPWGEGSAAYRVAAWIREHTGLETRVTVLGHIQRGGDPTAADRILATRLGAAAVEALRGGEAGVMMGAIGEDTVAVPLAHAAGQRPRPPVEWISLAEMLGI